MFSLWLDQALIQLAMRIMAILAHLHTVLYEEGGHAGVVLINCISSVNILFLRTVKTVALHEGAPKENTESEYRVRTVKRVILF